MKTLRETIPLRKQKIFKNTIKGITKLIIFYGIISIFLIAFIFSDSNHIPQSLLPYIAYREVLRICWFGLIFLLVIWNPIYHYLYFKRYFYDINNENIIIRKGAIAQKEITLPFSRITDVYVNQDILDVIFGLYDVHMSTPTEQSGQFAHIDGVDKPGNIKLKQLILKEINKY
ncbi:MAG: PH domain-containing protein [bacterium]